MQSDIDIAQAAKMLPIIELAKRRLGIAPEFLPHVFEEFVLNLKINSWHGLPARVRTFELKLLLYNRLFPS